MTFLYFRLCGPNLWDNLQRVILKDGQLNAGDEIAMNLAYQSQGAGKLGEKQCL